MGTKVNKKKRWYETRTALKIFNGVLWGSIIGIPAAIIINRVRKR